MNTNKGLIHLSENIYCIQVPEGAKDFMIHIKHGIPDEKWLSYYTGDNDMDYWDKIGKGLFEIIGLSSELSEEQAAELVPDKISERIEHPLNDVPPYDVWFFRDYMNGFFICTTGLDSLRSLMESKGCDLKLNWLLLKKNN